MAIDDSEQPWLLQQTWQATRLQYSEYIGVHRQGQTLGASWLAAITASPDSNAARSLLSYFHGVDANAEL